VDNAVSNSDDEYQYSPGELQFYDYEAAEAEKRAIRAPDAWERYTHGLPPQDDVDARLYEDFADWDRRDARLLKLERELAAVGVNVFGGPLNAAECRRVLGAGKQPAQLAASNFPEPISGDVGWAADVNTVSPAAPDTTRAAGRVPGQQA
jgi:hypothetical protein